MLKLKPDLKNNISARLTILHTSLKLLLILPGILAITGCSFIISKATGDLVSNLSAAILNNDDLATVESGGPAYLLMVDGLVQGEPDSVSLLSSAAKLYTAYTSVFIKDKVRAKKLTDKALNYAFRAVCSRRPEACSMRSSRYQTFVDIIAEMNVKDVPVLYSLGEAWAGWIQAHKDSLIAIAELSRVEAIMKRVVELNELYEDGGAHFYLGVFSTLLPPALGGRTEEGRKHFEKAIEISGGRNLMVKVTFARQYARLMFDRKLHDRLLLEVLKADPNFPGYTLINTLARQEAQELLDSADNYF
ncbi:MAG: TRAP transporter TatT component family protein [Deltaproteobacteria bacterium]|nr:TRAP transporter TatT component family protein [Deltaproteobacteria bacterium]